MGVKIYTDKDGRKYYKMKCKRDGDSWSARALDICMAVSLFCDLGVETILDYQEG